MELEYRHDPTGTTILDMGNGRVKVDLRFTPDTNIFLGQATWVEQTLESIAKQANRSIDVIFDLVHFEPTIWSAVMQARARQGVDNSTIVRKIAIVGDSILFSLISLTLALLTHNRDRIKYFFQMSDAKRWLEWE
jgi:hypothetical protein